jgi:hypothetical protein
MKFNYKKKVKYIFYLIQPLKLAPKGLKTIINFGFKLISDPMLTSVSLNLYAYDKIDLSEFSVVFTQNIHTYIHNTLLG